MFKEVTRGRLADGLGFRCDSGTALGPGPRSVDGEPLWATLRTYCCPEVNHRPAGSGCRREGAQTLAVCSGDLGDLL